MDHFDLIAIGGGTAGLETAAGAAALGLRVALVERHALGGDCLWTGCVPSKALIASAMRAHQTRHAERLGLAGTAPAHAFRSVMGGSGPAARSSRTTTTHSGFGTWVWRSCSGRRKSPGWEAFRSTRARSNPNAS